MDSAMKAKTWKHGSSYLDNEFNFDAVEYPQSPVFPPYEYPEEDHTKGYRNQTLRGSQRLLEHYNNEKGTNYELVEVISNVGMIKPNGLALHYNFKAKPANQNSRSSIELFFGEILVVSDGDHKVTYCDILNGESHGCKDCRENVDIKHPPAQHLSHNFYDDVSNTIPEIASKRCATVPMNSAKKAKTSEYGYPEDEEYDIEGHRNQTLIGAQESLEYYNNEKGTNYELVDALTSGGMIKPGGTAIHCNFTAKPANQDSDSSIKLFFGEILTYPNAVPIVTYCDILNGKSHGCKDCGENADIKHPPAQLLSHSYDDVSDTEPEMALKRGGATPMDPVKEKT